MSVKYFDEEQGKQIEQLEETMILDDDMSYFLVSLENMTKKVNLLSMIKMMSADDNGVNSEYKFYSSSYLNNKITDIYASINDMNSIFDDYTEIIETMKTNVDTSILNFEAIINGIDPKLQALEDQVQTYVDDKCNTLAQEIVTVNNRIDTVITDYQDADQSLMDYMREQFEALFLDISEGGEISESMYAQLRASLDELFNQMNTYVNNLVAKDTALLVKITALEDAMGDIQSTITNTFYSKEDIDNFLEEIYEKFTVEIISESADANGEPTNLDNIDANGIYLITQSTQALNLPPGSVNGILWVINCADPPSPFVKQIYFRRGTLNSNDHNMFMRSRGAGTWSTWAKVLTTKDIIYGTEVPTNLENGQIYLQYFV